MTRWNRTAYWLARFFFQQSGEVGVDPYFRLEAEKEAQERQSRHYISKLELELSPLRMMNQVRLDLLKDLALVDGLLSQGQHTEAQAMLRVALIKARRGNQQRQLSQNEIAAMMAGQMQQAPNPGLGGMAGLGGLGNAFDQMFRNRQWP